MSIQTRRRPWVIAGAAVTLLAALGLALGGPAWLRGGRSPAPASVKGHPTSLASVSKRTLSSQIRVDGTLGYAGSYSVVNQSRGTVTSLPPVGAVISQGQPLYAVDNQPVILLYGPVPAYRSMALGVNGPDVAQLNTNLADLGYGSDDLRGSDTFSPGTAAALKKLQAAIGLEPTGGLAFGQAVFLPTAARITAVVATLGAPAQPGGILLRAGSTVPQVTAALEAVRRSQVKVGDSVTVVLPDGRTTTGQVVSVATVASVPASSGGPGASGGRPTIPVEVKLTEPAAVGLADQVAVHVLITTARVTDALVVPVTALMAVAGVGYAVEVVDGAGTRRLVPVTLGLFDESGGLVQVSGAGLEEGQQVVVPGR